MKAGHQAMVELLLDRGANIEADNPGGETPLRRETPLGIAVKAGHQAMVELLLGRRANMEARDYCYRTALVLVTEDDHQEILQLLQSWSLPSSKLNAISGQVKLGVKSTEE